MEVKKYIWLSPKLLHHYKEGCVLLLMKACDKAGCKNCP